MKRRFYINRRTEETTHNAATALQWHNNGDDIRIEDLKRWGELGVEYCNPRTVHGAQTEKPDFESECRDTCKDIAEGVDAYADGIVHRCPECDEEIEFPDDVGDKFKCPHCGEVNDADDFETLTVYDYLEDALDWEYRVTRDKQYRSCEICVGWGGPNIYIDTADAYVHLYWGSTQTKYPIKYETSDALDEWAEEYYNMD